MDEIDFKWKFVEESLKILQEQIDKVNTAARAAMIVPESPLWEPAHIIGSKMVQVLSLLVDDHFDNISWFVSECDFGRDAKEAGCTGDMRKIDTCKKLRWLVELNCEN